MNKHCERNLPKAIIWLAIATGLVLLLALCGCASLQRLTSDERTQELFNRALAKLQARLEEKAENPADPEAPPIIAPDNKADEVDYASLRWDYGGFNGAGAMLHPVTTIGSLSITSSGMSYRWVAGGCEQLGASSRGDYNSTLACLFYKDPSGQWRGGKFDWISTSRTTRGFKNIHTGYVGWDSAACFAATDYAFVIVSVRNGTRTNVIKGSWQR